MANVHLIFLNVTIGGEHWNEIFKLTSVYSCFFLRVFHIHNWINTSTVYLHASPSRAFRTESFIVTLTMLFFHLISGLSTFFTFNLDSVIITSMSILLCSRIYLFLKITHSIVLCILHFVTILFTIFAVSVQVSEP